MCCRSCWVAVLGDSDECGCVKVFYDSEFTFSDWASRDLRLLVTFLSSSSRSPHLLKERKDFFFSNNLLRIYLKFTYCGENNCTEFLLTVLQFLPSLLPSPAHPRGWPVYERPGTKSQLNISWSDISQKNKYNPSVHTSSYLRSASSAMCLASLSCISWISIFSSSFMALFSITFMPLKMETMPNI